MASFSFGHFYCNQMCVDSLKVFTNRETYYFATEQIHYKTEIVKLISHPIVSYIADPNLVGTCQLPACNQVVESYYSKTISRFMKIALTWHSITLQHTEALKTIATHGLQI